MTKSAHTPGQWESDGQFIVAPDPNGVHSDIYIAEIAQTDDEGRVATPEQQAVNAHLIAAAPDMFAALEEAEFALRVANRYHIRKDRRSSILDSRLEIIRGAIAKAGGIL